MPCLSLVFPTPLAVRLFFKLKTLKLRWMKFRSVIYVQHLTKLHGIQTGSLAWCCCTYNFPIAQKGQFKNYLEKKIVSFNVDSCCENHADFEFCSMLACLVSKTKNTKLEKLSYFSFWWKNTKYKIFGFHCAFFLFNKTKKITITAVHICF